MLILKHTQLKKLHLQRNIELLFLFNQLTTNSLQST